MAEGEIVPEIRFNEFEDSWEQRPASELAVFSKGKGYSKADLTDEGTPIILYGRLYTKYQFAIDDVDTFAVPRSGSVYSKGNEVIVPASGETAKDIARAAAVEKSGVLLGGDLNILRPQDSVIPPFLALAVSNGASQRELTKRAQGKSIVHIHNSDIQDIFVSYPSRAEQEQIVALFRSLDHLIALHQKKYSQLCNMKTAMLEKMFPKDGADVPEIRFTGFTDPWEQCELGETTELLEYGLNAAARAYDGENKYIRITDIDDNTRQFKTTDLTSPDTDLRLAAKYRLQAGDIVFARTGASVGKTYLYKPSDGIVYYAGYLIRARILPGYNADFIYQSTLTERYKNFVSVTSQRSGQPGVNAQEYSEFDFLIPTIEEQKKVGEFFGTLDHLITLQQRKVEHLNNLKKAFLDKMFV